MKIINPDSIKQNKIFLWIALATGLTLPIALMTMQFTNEVGEEIIKRSKAMKITICGSVKFADKLVAIYRQLEKLGHEPVMHEEMFGIADGTAKELIDGIGLDHSEVKKKHNFIKLWHNLICGSDAILVCNFDKNGIKNYIGGNTLMEIGFAHVNDKKVFLLNPIPEDVSYADEIKAMVDVVVEGDLSKVKL